MVGVFLIMGVFLEEVFVGVYRFFFLRLLGFRVAGRCVGRRNGGGVVV